MIFEHAVKKRIWRAAELPPAENTHRIADELGILETTARLLCARGLDTPERAAGFIGKETGRLYDPYLLKDMDRAVKRIRKALVSREKIMIYGDYDVDGVTSVSILYDYLRIHSADVSYYIPNRIGDGYGVNSEAMRSFAKDGYTLVITVDTGVTAVDEIAEAAALGLDTVVTDHHECRPELPDCPVVNPRRPDCSYPFKQLAGVGVAFKLICALEQDLRSTTLYNAVKFAINRVGELTAVGTVADVMPLVGENRIIVSYGLGLLERTRNPGLRALLCAAGAAYYDENDNFILKKRMSTSLVGFTLAPRINAAGRLTDASIAVELFLTEYPAVAEKIADELCEINRRRQAEENSILEQAEARIAEQCLPSDRVIVLGDDGWHHGVIGIVCSRLTEKYDLPSILVSFEGQTSDPPSPEDIGKGSGRSVKGMNLVEALEDCGELLVKYGGHELAAGLSIRRGKLGEFRRRINDRANEAFGKGEPERVLDIDLELKPAEITMRLANELYLLEPYGAGNALPVFETDHLVITELTRLSNGKHTRLTVSGGGNSFTALLFGKPSDELGFSVGDAVDLAYNLDVNEFRGRSAVQLLVKDIRRSEDSDRDKICPTRAEFARLWRFIQSQAQGGSCRIGVFAGAAGVGEDTVSLMLEIFAELGLIQLVSDGQSVSAIPLPKKEKVDLESSEIYSRLLHLHKE